MTISSLKLAHDTYVILHDGCAVAVLTYRKDRTVGDLAVDDAAEALGRHLLALDLWRSAEMRDFDGTDIPQRDDIEALAIDVDETSDD